MTRHEYQNRAEKLLSTHRYPSDGSLVQALLVFGVGLTADGHSTKADIFLRMANKCAIPRAPSVTQNSKQSLRSSHAPVALMSLLIAVLAKHSPTRLPPNLSMKYRRRFAREPSSHRRDSLPNVPTNPSGESR
jgi:hypothetical protein